MRSSWWHPRRTPRGTSAGTGRWNGRRSSGCSTAATPHTKRDAAMAVAADQEQRQKASWRSLTAIVDFAVGSHARAIAVLLVASLVSFLPGFFSTPPIDRDEARFAQATKQMVESGDYVDIRFQDEVRYKKPVGIYWLQAAVVEAASALGFQ